jgi:heparan-alpha-glucosaminide N-acetyltransferase
MTSQSAAPAARSRTLDVLRGLTILVMIFVNDLAGVQNVPAWMKHVQPHDADGMTFVDVVFPAFLFIVGLSIPLALGKRLETGEPRWRTWRHVLTRTGGLLLIGLFMVNAENISSEGRLSPALWSLFFYAAVFLLFGAAPRDGGSPTAVRLRRWAGVALLVAAALVFRGRGEPGLMELRPHWWGILGLIGWAYLVACTIFILLRKTLAGVVGTIPLLYCLYVAQAAGAFSGFTWLSGWIEVGSMLGSHAAITVSGLAMGIALGPESAAAPHAQRLRWALLYSLGLAAAAHLLHAAHGSHSMFIFNKIFATPPWCLLSSAITVAVWALLYWIIDVRGSAGWAALLEGAGQNALTAYLLAFVLDVLLTFLSQITGLPNVYAALGDRFATGFGRAILLSLAIAWLASRLRRTSLQLVL